MVYVSSKRPTDSCGSHKADPSAVKLLANPEQHGKQPQQLRANAMWLRNVCEAPKLNMVWVGEMKQVVCQAQKMPQKRGKRGRRKGAKKEQDKRRCKPLPRTIGQKPKAATATSGETMSQCSQSQ